MFWFGGPMVMAGTITLGTLVAFNTYLPCSRPGAALGDIVNSDSRGVACAERIFEVLDTPFEIRRFAECHDAADRPGPGRSSRTWTFQYSDGRAANPSPSINLDASRGR